MSSFSKRFAQLKDDLITQGDRVVEHVVCAVEAFFDSNKQLAEQIIEADNVIDRVDVEIERASIPLLGMGQTDEHAIRSVLTVVKVNNELERIADCAVDIAEVVIDPEGAEQPVPNTFRVMANSVIGMLQDANKALAETDTQRAEGVLACDDAVNSFQAQIVRDAQREVAAGRFDVDFAFRLLVVTRALDQIADHCTNICEQIIYLATGKIVRHLPQGWSKPEPPDVLN